MRKFVSSWWEREPENDRKDNEGPVIVSKLKVYRVAGDDFVCIYFVFYTNEIIIS